MNLYFDLMTSLKKKNVQANSFLSSSVESEVRKIEFIDRPYFLYSPSSFRDIFKLRSFILGLGGYLYFVRLQKFETVIFVMPSPFDLPLYFLGRLKRLNIICCIHDITAHPGEAWPRSGAISARTRQASSLVAFSLPIANSLELSTGKPVDLAHLPDTIPLLGELGADVQALIHKMNASNKITVLLIGRINAYKNAEMIAQVASKLPDFLFFIAGQLNSKLGIAQNLVTLDKWLSNIEFDSILREADIVIFPYSEASQSGTIPLAISHQKIIVAADHPGFRDQLKSYEGKVIFEPNNETLCSFALVEAGKMLRRSESHQERPSENSSSVQDLASLLLDRMKSS